ncbi:MAG: serine acetyltransferase [Candidatus Melainabacteria bacterium RIFOXYA2_FULL_32_9]|nr:MAG: serine acetyltransferase [Candidatus Melainabacteria bacterium RIFOXYA2_FULL_32_9]
MSGVVYFLYKIARALYLAHIPLLPALIKLFIRVIFACSLPYTAKIGENTILGYGGLGIVIHSDSIIGKNCIISQGVTIGGSSRNPKVPEIGNNVLVGAGAKIIGPIKIADNVVIGANSVVTKDIPSNVLVAGIPARVIKENININDYL